MKKLTTIKAIKANYNKVFRCGYCDLQYIYKYQEANFFNRGVYGWNCDIYTDNKKGIAITTGYRNMTGKCIPSELIEKYSKTADLIVNYEGRIAPFEEVLKKLEENRENFLQELATI